MKRSASWSKPDGVPGLIGRKKVDPSFILHGDTTIPQAFHTDFDEANAGEHLEKGDRRELVLELWGRLYTATLRNAARDDKYGDTYKIQFQSSDIFPVLQRELSASKEKLERLREEAETEDTKTYVKLPDAEAEYVEFYETGEPFRYRVELVTRDSKDSSSSNQEQVENDLANRPNDPDLDGRDFEARLEERRKAGNHSVEDSWSRQKVRRAQELFREMVLSNFGEKCAVCGLDEPALLDAAHIERWNDAPDRRLDPTNGVLLCTLHHRAFDRGLLDIAGGVVHVHGGDHTGRSSAFQEMIGWYDGEELSDPMTWRTDLHV